jgi:hypothetical protein
MSRRACCTFRRPFPRSRAGGCIGCSPGGWTTARVAAHTQMISRYVTHLYGAWRRHREAGCHDGGG